MIAAAPSIYNSPNGDFEAVDGELQIAAHARRLKRRRQTLRIAGASHLVNVGLLAIFAVASTISWTAVLSFACVAAASVAIFAAISESGITDKWSDHFIGLPYATVTCALLMGFIYALPEVTIVFLCALFLNANLIAMRATPQQAIAAWAIITVGVGALFAITDVPLSLPFANATERLGTLLTFSATIARSLFIGVFASSLRNAMFQRGVELEAAYRRIEELSELDDLTGAFNRRCIMRLLDDEIMRAQRSKTPLAIALIDLDWFKQINDKFGHPTGDEVLRTFAITMFANIRSIDTFGRYGGEEFLLLLPDTTPDQATKILNRLGSIVEELDWSAFSSNLTVTISAGIAILNSDETPETLLARADGALYAAKESGRNRITTA